ncbi:MAG TPA: flagellar biosynthetic protein FliR [Solirubrobacteraceae bacterium]|nr:flagellar biosynthetic protein FliR [Solirubrobacteraceae bacterium]
MRPIVQQFGEQQVAGFFLVLARVSPLFVLAPLFSSQLMPPRVRGIVAVALAIGLVPVVARERISMDTFELAGLVGKELLVGLAFAFAIGALFAALSVAGTFLDTSIGFSFGAIVDPISGAQSAVLAQLYALIGVLIFIAIGGDAWVVQGVAQTYDLVPLHAFPSLGAMTSGALTAFVGIFGAAIQVAGPVLLALILTDAAFGMVSRVVPQLNVFAVGFAAKIVVGLLVLGVTLPFLAGWLSDELEASISDALRMLRIGG